MLRYWASPEGVRSVRFYLDDIVLLAGDATLTSSEGVAEASVAGDGAGVAEQDDQSVYFSARTHPPSEASANGPPGLATVSGNSIS